MAFLYNYFVINDGIPDQEKEEKSSTLGCIFCCLTDTGLIVDFVK